MIIEIILTCMFILPLSLFLYLIVQFEIDNTRHARKIEKWEG